MKTDEQESGKKDCNLIYFCFNIYKFSKTIFYYLICYTKNMQNQTQSLLEIVLANMDHGVVVCGADKLIQRVNQTFEKVTGYAADEVSGKGPKILFPEQQGPDIFSIAKDSLDNGDIWHGEIMISCREGDTHPFHLSIYVVYNQAGQLLNYVIIMRNAVKDRGLDKDNGLRANHDGLTRLPNGYLFRDRSEQGLVAARRAKKSVAILFFGLDRFTIINDGLGYSFGDSLLKSVAQRLKDNVRTSDTIARIEGDRFAVMLQVAAADDGVLIAEKLLQSMKQPFTIEGQEATVTASIGISLYPIDGEDVDVLAKRAESAMRHAKKEGGNQFLFFANDMNMKAKNRIEMENSLRRALQRKEFLLYYQPKVAIQTQQITGMEALVRWQQPGKGLISPVVFIPVAEETGLIEPIGLWVLQEACCQNKQWQDKGLQPVRVSVNISARQFRTPDLVDNVKEVLENSGLSPQYLELEITESVLMGNMDENIDKLQQIRDLGCHLSIDDFGTGYSNLSYLTRFPISTLKIDRAFIRDLETNQNTAEITHAIIGMSHGLKLEVVAEGAETSKHIDFLRKHGCETVQGYFYSRPVPPEEFEKLLAVGFIKRD